MAEFFVHSFNNLSHLLVGYAVPFLFVLTIVVFFHELGHFLVARWAGVKVLTFSLGFGPELAGFNDRSAFERSDAKAVRMTSLISMDGSARRTTPEVDDPVMSMRKARWVLNSSRSILSRS